MKIDYLAPKAGPALSASIQKRIDKLALKAANAWVKQARDTLTARVQGTSNKEPYEIERIMARLESAPLPKFNGWPAATKSAPRATGCRFVHYKNGVRVPCAAAGCPGVDPAAPTQQTETYRPATVSAPVVIQTSTEVTAGTGWVMTT